MEKSEVIEVLEALAEGIDPETGEVFKEDSPYNQPKVIRALYQALMVFKNYSASKPAERAGKPWSDSEDRELVEGFRVDRSMAELAKAHQRTRGAIRSRLIKLGEIEDSKS